MITQEILDNLFKELEYNSSREEEYWEMIDNIPPRKWWQSYSKYDYKIKALYTHAKYWENMHSISLKKYIEKENEYAKYTACTCMVCSFKFMGPRPLRCCSGGDCGCMGLPIDPVICSSECYEKLINKK